MEGMMMICRSKCQPRLTIVVFCVIVVHLDMVEARPKEGELESSGCC